MAAIPPAGGKAPRGPLRTALLFVGALLFLFEEWLWTGLTRFLSWLGRFGLLRWLDARLAKVPPVAALVILCVPIVLLFPFKVAGLWMIASGRFFSGCLLMLAAKVVSTAVIARIFLSCRPQLLQMPWFARLYEWTGVVRDRIHRWIERQPAWFQAKRFARITKTRIREWTSDLRSADSSRNETGRRGALRRWRSRRRSRRTDVYAQETLVRAKNADRGRR